jgi:hypothetical protein
MIVHTNYLILEACNRDISNPVTQIRIYPSIFFKTS